MTRKSLLVCLPAAPFPARQNGISVRYAPILTALKNTFDIDVIQVVSPWAPEMATGADKGLFRRYDNVVRSREKPSIWRRFFVRVRTFFYPRPPQMSFALDRTQVAANLSKLLQHRYYDCALWICPEYADEAAPTLREHAKRVVYDAIDSPYSVALKATPRSPLAKWDLHWLRRWEQHICRCFDCAIYISQSDIDLMSRGDAGVHTNITQLPNGVLHDDYTPEIADVDGISPDDFVIGFLGHMAYGPNVQAALRLNRIFQTLGEEIPNARLLVIGRSPAKSVRELAHHPGVVVTGTVDNIWPFINRVDAFVFPMETGAGQQNKVLEAMFAGTPVIATSVANNGIVAAPNQHILIGDSDQEIRNHILSLWRAPAKRAEIGSRGRQFVEHTYSWEAIIHEFRRILLNEETDG